MEEKSLRSHAFGLGGQIRKIEGCRRTRRGPTPIQDTRHSASRAIFKYAAFTWSSKVLILRCNSSFQIQMLGLLHQWLASLPLLLELFQKSGFALLDALTATGWIDERVFLRPGLHSCKFPLQVIVASVASQKDIAGQCLEDSDGLWGVCSDGRVVRVIEDVYSRTDPDQTDLLC